MENYTFVQWLDGLCVGDRLLIQSPTLYVTSFFSLINKYTSHCDNYKSSTPKRFHGINSALFEMQNINLFCRFGG